MLSFGSASSALPQHQEVLDRLRRTSAQLDTLQRRLAFERVYEEGRWKNGADSASCSSGWSDVGRGQATKAVSALVDVVEEHAVRSYMDLPVGDGCFSSNALRLLRKKQNVSYIGLDIVREVVEHNLVKRDNATQLIHADVVSLTRLPGPTDLVFSRQMMQHMCNRDALHVLDLISRSGARLALLTHFETDEDNSDIECNSGGYRPQNLLKPPFWLPPPLRYWPENYSVDQRVGLGLWALPLPPVNQQVRASWWQRSMYDVRLGWWAARGAKGVLVQRDDDHDDDEAEHGPDWEEMGSGSGFDEPAPPPSPPPPSPPPSSLPEDDGYPDLLEEQYAEQGSGIQGASTIFQDLMHVFW